MLRFTAVTCSSLSSISSGVIAYIPDTTPPFDLGTVAVYLCNEGFNLTGNNLRTCSGDGSSVSGVWGGSAPVCAGRYTQVIVTSFHYLEMNTFKRLWNP